MLGRDGKADEALSKCSDGREVGGDCVGAVAVRRNQARIRDGSAGGFGGCRCVACSTSEWQIPSDCLWSWQPAYWALCCFISYSQIRIIRGISGTLNRTVSDAEPVPSDRTTRRSSIATVAACERSYDANKKTARLMRYIVLVNGKGLLTLSGGPPTPPIEPCYG